jgi:hypothetical protein
MLNLKTRASYRDIALSIVEFSSHPELLEWKKELLIEMEVEMKMKMKMKVVLMICNSGVDEVLCREVQSDVQ